MLFRYKSIIGFQICNYFISFDATENETTETPDEKYLKRDEETTTLINLCIEDSEIIHDKQETTAKGTWDKLKVIHDIMNLYSKIFLLSSFQVRLSIKIIAKSIRYKNARRL